MASNTDDRTALFLEYVCPYTPILWIGFSIAILFALASVVFALLLPPDSGAFVVALMSLVIDGFVILVTGGLLRACNRVQSV